MSAVIGDIITGAVSLVGGGVGGSLTLWWSTKREQRQSTAEEHSPPASSPAVEAEIVDASERFAAAQDDPYERSLDKEIAFLNWGMGRANGSAVAQELVARHVNAFSERNIRRIDQGRRGWPR